MHINNVPPLLHYDVKKIKHLFLSTAIRLFGAGMLGTFVALIVFQLWKDTIVGFNYVLIFFVLQSFFAVVFDLFLSAKIIHQRGTKVSMMVWIVALLVYQNLFLFFDWSMLLLRIAPIFIALFIACFWTAFHFNIATAQRSKRFWSQVALLNIIITIALSLSPLIWGYIFDWFGIEYLVVVANIFVFLSIIPLAFSSKEHQDCFPLKQKHLSLTLIKRLLNQRKDAVLKAFAGKGYIEFIGSSIRPLIIFVMYKKFSAVWLIVTLTTIFSVVLLYIVGRFLDKHQDSKVVKWTMWMQYFTWIIALLTVFWKFFNAILLSFVDMMSKFSKNLWKTCIEKKMYDYSKDKTQDLTYVMMHEVGIHFLRLLVCLVAIPCNLFFGFYPTVIILLLGLVGIVHWQYGIFRKKYSGPH